MVHCSWYRIDAKARSVTKDANSTYRKKIYENYGHNFQGIYSTADESSIKRWGQAYKWYLQGWFPSDPSAKIAELACGQGRLLSFLISEGFKDISAVDISPDQVKIARGILPSVDHGNVLEWLATKDNYFELIVALDLIEHLSKDEVLLFLERCFRAIQPGGRLILQTPNADSPFGIQLRYGDLTHELIFSPDLLGYLLRQAGFEQVSAREQGPVPVGYSVVSSLRFLVWRIIRALIVFWNYVETGSSRAILTRVYFISGEKPRIDQQRSYIE